MAVRVALVPVGFLALCAVNAAIDWTPWSIVSGILFGAGAMEWVERGWNA